MGKLFNNIFLLSVTLITIIFVYLYVFTYLFGGFNLAIYEYGYVFTVLLILFTFVLLICIILQKKSKNKFLLFCITIILITYMVIPSKIVQCLREKYSKFDYQTWNNQPVVRQEMYHSLETELKIIGMKVDRVIELIGTPDYKDKDVIIYDTIPGHIYIYVNDNIITKVEYITPID